MSLGASVGKDSFGEREWRLKYARTGYSRAQIRYRCRTKRQSANQSQEALKTNHPGFTNYKKTQVVRLPLRSRVRIATQLVLTVAHGTHVCNQASHCNSLPRRCWQRYVPCTCCSLWHTLPGRTAPIPLRRLVSTLHHPARLHHAHTALPLLRS